MNLEKKTIRIYYMINFLGNVSSLCWFNLPRYVEKTGEGSVVHTQTHNWKNKHSNKTCDE